MAEQKMTIGENETTYNSLSEDEVKGIVDASLDEKLSALQIPETFDSDAFKESLLGEVGSLLEKQQSKSDDAITKKISKLFDDRLSNALKGFSNGESKEKGPGPLARFLFGN